MQKARIDIYQEMAVSKENCWVLRIPQDIKPKSQLGVISPLLECTNKKDFLMLEDVEKTEFWHTIYGNSKLV